MTTKTQYLQSLKILDKFNINYKTTYTKTKLKKIIEQIKDIPNQRNSLSNDKISIGTVKKYIIAIIYYLKSNNKYTNNMKKLFIPVIDEYNKALQDKVENNTLEGEQKKNYIEWEDVIKIYNDLAKTDYEKSYKLYTNFVLLSIYVLFPVRRSMDYVKMKIGKPKGKLFNYYYEGKFYFNIYKTSKSMGSQVFDVPIKLAKILDDYITTYKIKGFLFKDFNNNAIYSKLCNMLDKKASVTILRHSFISYVLNNNKLSIKNKRKLAEQMAHSLEMQAEYVKLD